MSKSKKMTIEEMVNCFRIMFSQAVAERSQDYGVVMEEAYNLWALLYYDLGIEYPPYDLPQGHETNEPFVF